MSDFLWSQQGMILRPPDYESGATNQLSYGTKLIKELICVRSDGAGPYCKYNTFFRLVELDFNLNT